MSKKVGKYFLLDEELDKDLRRLCTELKVSQNSLFKNVVEIIVQTIKRERGEV